jgi:hypothetical protein
MTKRLRVQLLGTAALGDPYRVALPTYSMVDFDKGTMSAIVDVPDDTYPPAPLGKPETVTQDAKYGPVITGVSLEQAIDAANYYDKKYREHTSQYGLDVK